MTREEARQLLPIIQAYAEGKTIQFLDGGKWADVYETDFYQFPDKYRIKPESNYRPFKTQEECWNEMMKHHPFGSLKSKDNEYFCLIGSVNKDNTITLAIEPNTDYSCTCIFEHYIFSDGTPFGVKEEKDMTVSEYTGKTINNIVTQKLVIGSQNNKTIDYESNTE